MGGLMRITEQMRAVALSLLVALPLSTQAARLSGKVINTDDGRGVARIAVTLSFAEGHSGPAAVTVFTASDGAFQVDESTLNAADRIELSAHTPGLHQAEAVAGRFEELTAKGPVVLQVRNSANIAAEVPASAWMANMPAGAERNITLTSCSSCHQMASPRVREYAAQIEAVSKSPGGDRKALEAWRKVVRHEAWRTIVKYMRSKHYAVFPIESPTNLDNVDWTTAQNADYNFFNVKMGETIAKYLAEHFPRSTDFMARDDYGYGAAVGATEKTVIREYAFPKDALVREMVGAPGSPYLWGADVRRNFVVRLDPKDGNTKWYAPPYDGSTGPHTIVPGDDGSLWVSMIDHNQFSHFDPKTEKWQLWTLQPTNLPDTKALAGVAIVHDLSIDSRGHMARDVEGNIWLTLAGSNQLATLNPDNGQIAFHNINSIKGLSPINHLLYSAVMSADGRQVWYSQLNGSVGCMDAKTKKVVKLIPFPEGTGPRRMTRDNNGHLWVTFFGSGQIAKIDMASAKVVATYDLPDRAASPYAATWDEGRQALWVVTANSDVIYRLDPKTGAFTVYPLPRSMAYLRQVAVEPGDGRLVASYGNYPEGSGPSMGVVIDIGDR